MLQIKYYICLDKVIQETKGIGKEKFFFCHYWKCLWADVFHLYLNFYTYAKTHMRLCVGVRVWISLCKHTYTNDNVHIPICIYVDYILSFNIHPAIWQNIAQHRLLWKSIYSRLLTWDQLGSSQRIQENTATSSKPLWWARTCNICGPAFFSRFQLSSHMRPSISYRKSMNFRSSDAKCVDNKERKRWYFSSYFPQSASQYFLFYYLPDWVTLSLYWIQDYGKDIWSEEIQHQNQCW